jgi:ATP-binding cassette, subfamily F, member 3
VVLDEPTNHLDIDSRSALIAAINDYPGAVILVSHDRYLIEACADRLLLVANGEVAPFDGDLDDYRRLVLSKSAERVLSKGEETERSEGNKEAGAPRGGRAEIRRAAAEKRIELAPLRRRITAAETAVARLTAEIARIDTALAESGLFARDPAKAAALAKARADHAAALAKAEEEWLEASAEQESVIRGQ